MGCPSWRRRGVFAWDDAAQDWVSEAYCAAGAEATEAVLVGHVAADFGEFPGAVGDAAAAEIVVVAARRWIRPATGRVRVMTVGGTSSSVRSTRRRRGRAWRGGVADGRRLRRRRAARVRGRGRQPVRCSTRCDIAGDGSRLDRRRPAARRAVEPSVAGPQLQRDRFVGFDFDADGTAEVVYGDECFARIYRGTDGDAVFAERVERHGVRVRDRGRGRRLQQRIVVALNSGVAVRRPIRFTRGTSTFESQNG